MPNENLEDTQTTSREGAPAPDRALVCACVNLNHGDYKSFLSKNSGARFEEVLALTKAGSTCTACLLDLEYHYVEFRRNNVSAELSGSDRISANEYVGLKRRLFDFIDRHSPMVPFKLVERLPVISGADIEQRLWISNRSLLFKGKRGAPPYNLEIKIRDEAGRVRQTVQQTVEPESAFDLKASDFIPLPEAGADLSVGSIEIRRYSSLPGVRGTTRPQTEILAPKGACSVHAQAYKTAGEKWFDVFHRPEDQRLFLTYINFENSPVTINLGYPMNAEHLGVMARTQKLILPPYGATLTEIDLSQEEVVRLQGHELTLNWTSDGSYNCHIICATPDLKRMSIDHS